ELLTIFLSLPITSPGRKAALAFLRERHLEFDAFNAVWRTSADRWETLASFANVEAPYHRRPPYQRTIRGEEAANRADPRRAACADDCDAFAALVAERYFSLTCAALKAADPHHLILGCRFAYVPPRAIIEAAGRHCDVVSFNCYDVDPSTAIDAYTVSGKPCLIGEFSFRSADS